MGPVIVQMQNKEWSIRCLAAARHIYSRTKLVFAWQIILTAPVVVALSIFNSFYNIEWYVALYCVLITIFDLVFIDDFIAKQKEAAATIQEMFDTYVLGIEWNDFINKIDDEIIFRYSEKYKKKEGDFNALTNWYPLAISRIKSDNVKIICQVANCRYDLSIRKCARFFMYSISIMACCCIIYFAAYYEVTLKNVFILIMLPVLPIITLLMQRLKEIKLGIETLENMKRVTTTSWEKLLQGANLDITRLSRTLQDCIYKNRKNGLLIFNWIYNLHRERFEAEMNYGAEQLIDQYRQATKQEGAK